MAHIFGLQLRLHWLGNLVEEAPFRRFALALASSGSVLGILGTAHPPLHGPTLLITLISGAVIGVSLFRGSSPVRTPTLSASAPAAVRTELNWARTVGGMVFLIAGLSLCVEAGRGPGAGSALALAVLFLTMGAFLLPSPRPLHIMETAALAAAAVVFGHDGGGKYLPGLAQAQREAALRGNS